MTLVFSLLRCYTELNALRKGGYTCNGLERLRFLQKRKPLSFSGSKCTLLYLSAESGACSMRPAALLWGAFVLHRRFPFVKASPLGRGVTEGDGEGYTTKHHSGVVMSQFQHPRPSGRYDFSAYLAEKEAKTHSVRSWPLFCFLYRPNKSACVPVRYKYNSVSVW